MPDERGFLTATDRAFLRGEKEYEAKQSRYQRREAIAGRARAAFEDFALLLDVMDEAERNRVFDVEPAGERPTPDEGLYADLVDTIAFLYLGLEGELGNRVAQTRPFSVPFDDAIRAGVRRGERARHDRRVAVDVTGLKISVRTDIDVHAINSAIDKIARESYNELTYSEMFAVLQRFGTEESYERLQERVHDVRRRRRRGVEGSDVNAAGGGDAEE